MTQGSPLAQSLNIVAMDAQPLVPLTSGEGAPGYVKVQDDYIAVTTAMLAAGSVWRLARIPVNAKIKRVQIYSDGALDSNASQQLALDFNIAFSDSTIDGTRTDLQAKIPTTANDGTVTTEAAYSSPNKLFGTLTQAGNDVAISLTDITFQGQLIYNSLLLTETPLWKLFGFTDGLGYPRSPGGFFNILVDVSTAAATAHAANFYIHIEYVE